MKPFTYFRKNVMDKKGKIYFLKMKFSCVTPHILWTNIVTPIHEGHITPLIDKIKLFNMKFSDETTNTLQTKNVNPIKCGHMSFMYGGNNVCP
jgi:hypothetical protein